MRLGLVLRRIPLRREMSGSPIDAEWLVDRLQNDELLIHVDQDGPGASLVREAGGEVTVSPKRIVEVEGRWTADELAMRQLAIANRARPLDGIVVDGDLAVSPSWLEPALRGVPVGVTVGAEAFSLSRLLLEDRHLAQRHVMGLWSAAGSLAAADFHVGGAPPGFVGIEGIPPRPLLMPYATPHGTDQLPDPPDLVVVVSTHGDRARYASLIDRMLARVPIAESTTVVAVVPDIDVGYETPGQLVASGAPGSLRGSVIVAPTGLDGVAEAFLNGADLIVADSVVDAAVPAVVHAALGTPLVILGGAPPTRPLELAAPNIPPARAPGERIVLSVDGDLAAVSSTLEATDADLAIIHSGAGGAHAARMFSSLRAGGADVVVMGQPDPVHGSPRYERIVPSVVAIDRRAFGTAARVMRSVPDLWTFIAATMDPSNAASIHLEILPASVGTPTVDLIGVEKPRHRWAGAGPLPLSARLDIVRTAAVGQSTKTKDVGLASARAWAKTHRWPDRVRMALPWKWGLLDRAMKGRW